MAKGIVQIYYGQGRGKSTAALGNAIGVAGLGQQVVVIEFLKGKEENVHEYLKRLEPEIKFFRFSRRDDCFESLTEEEKQEETMNLRNGFSYGKKVACTGACDLLVMDEVLGLVDEKVISVEELKEFFENRADDMDIICTGRSLHDDIRKYADEIYNITPEKMFD